LPVWRVPCSIGCGRRSRIRICFATPFPQTPTPFTIERIVDALACFQRTITSARSPYDRYHFGRDETAVAAAVKRGEVLFFSGEMAGCFQCRGGPSFSGGLRSAADPEPDIAFHNTSLYNLAGLSSYPPPNTGLYEHTNRASDVGRFRAPTLRNIALTASYMHDGSVGTLEEVIDHYSAGGRTITSGPHRGVGSANPNKSPAVDGFELSDHERADLGVCRR